MTVTTTDLRHATAADIVRRLTGTTHRVTAGTMAALGAGMGDAQHGIVDALDDAIRFGYVVVKAVRDTTYGRNIRFVTLADGVVFCRTCVDGCDHGGRSGGEPGSCGHLGCWGPDSTGDCAGAAFARSSAYGTRV